MTETIPTPAPASGGPIAAGGEFLSSPPVVRWEALLTTEGLSLNRLEKAPAVLKRAALLYEGVPVRVATSFCLGHGVLDHSAASPGLRKAWSIPHAFKDHQLDVILSRFGAAGLDAIVAGERAIAVIGDDKDPALVEPSPVGIVERAWYEPGDGIRGVLAFDERTVTTGPFVWLGIIRPPEAARIGVLRAYRAGHGAVLRVSSILQGPMREDVASDGLPAVIQESISRVVAVDLVGRAASEAQLIRPLDPGEEVTP